MVRQNYFVFLFLVSAVLLVLPSGVKAQLELSQQEAMTILNAAQQGLVDEWLDLTASPTFDEPAKQAALFLIRNAIQQRELRFGFYELPKNYLKAVVKLAARLLASPEEAVRVVLEKIEKETVKEAVDTAADWLLANEVRISRGPLPYSFVSYKDNWQKPPLHYFVAYKQDDVAIEFYSPETVEPQEPKKASVLGLGNTLWEFSEWRAAGNETLPPFLIRVKGEVKKTEMSFQWLKTEGVAVVFDEPVPLMPETKEPLIAKLPIIGDYYRQFQQRFEQLKAIVKKISEMVRSATGALALPQTQEPQKSISQRLIEENLSVLDLEKVAGFLEQDISSREEQQLPPRGPTEAPVETAPALGRGGPFSEQELQELLVQAQDELDDIAERIDVLSQQAVELVGSEASGLIEQDETETRQEQQPRTSAMVEENEDDEDQEDEQTPSFSPAVVGQPVGQGTSPIFCQKIPDRPPLNNKVILNEIAWMGFLTSANDEWIELKNITAEPVPLAGWQILDKAQNIKIIFSQEVLAANDFLLLERTDDNSVPAINADLIYTGGLKNSDEALYFFDSACQLQDEALAAPNWPAGDNTAKKTMERRPDLNWQTSAEPGGTPKQENSQPLPPYATSPGGAGGAAAPPAPGPTPAPSPTPPSQPENQSPIAQFIYLPSEPAVGQEILFTAASSTDPDGQITAFLWDFGDGAATSTTQVTTTHSFSASSTYLITLRVLDNLGATSTPATTTIAVVNPPAAQIPSLAVVINEIGWMGTKAEASDEWLELYNNTTSTLNITGWRLVSSDGKPDITFPTTTLPANSFYLLERTNDNNTISDIPADWKGSFGSGSGMGLGNNPDCEVLFLYDDKNGLIDQTVCLANSHWPAGDNDTKQTMERISANASGTDPQNWANNNLISKNGKDAANNTIYGTPKQENSVAKSQTELTNANLNFSQFDTITLTKLGSPYIVQNTLTVPQNKTLLIEPQVILKFIPSNIPGWGAYLNIQGTLKAVGQPSKEIIFTSVGDTAWPGLYFGPTSKNSDIRYARIEKARSWELTVHSAIKVEQSDLVLQNLQIENSSNKYGIFLKNSSSTIDTAAFSQFKEAGAAAVYLSQGRALIRNSSFSDNYYGVVIDTAETCLNNPEFVVSGNSFTRTEAPVYVVNYGLPCFKQNTVSQPGKDNSGNVFNGILLVGATVLYDTLWQSDLPLIIEKPFFIQNATLTIASGIQVRFKYTSDPGLKGYLAVEQNGRLEAVSDPSSPIIFTSAGENPQPGDWRGLWLKNTSQAVLKNVRIEYAGFDWKAPLKIEAGANVVQENVEIPPAKNLLPP